jgi:polar amino acid transport system ATP-binding protein
MSITNEIILDVRNLHKYYVDNHILKGIGFQVKRGELISIIGRSGCGKTTLLRCLNCLEYFDEGVIRIAGITLNRKLNEIQLKKDLMQKAKDISKRMYKPFTQTTSDSNFDEDFQIKALTLRKRVGMLFQSLNLFPHLSVLENVTLAPIVVNNENKTDAIETARKLLLKVGLEHLKDRYPSQLSGGQAQRVGIARALAMSPQVMLYDEPTSALDPELVGEVIEVMNNLHKEGMTQIIVTHSMGFAKNASDRVMFMEEGSIIEFDSPGKIFGSPQDERTQKYINIFKD